MGVRLSETGLSASLPVGAPSGLESGSPDIDMNKGETPMVYVRLEKEWTDPEGRTHAAGDTVDVDAATLAELQASGIVGEQTAWPGPTGDDKDWVGPTGGTTVKQD